MCERRECERMFAERNRHMTREAVVDVDRRGADRNAEVQDDGDDAAGDRQSSEREDEAVGNVESIP